MARKINILIKLADQELADAVMRVVTDDWTAPWTFVSPEGHDANPDETDLAVMDGSEYLASLDGRVIKIIVGVEDPGGRFFAAVPEPNAERVFNEIRRANSYREIVAQNQESLYPEAGRMESLETIAHSLSNRVNQLMRQAEMRIALVDQLPVGVLGVDDEGMVALANPLAVEILGIGETPIWGMHLAELVSEEVWRFTSDDETKEMKAELADKVLTVRKGPFFLNECYAGTILLLIENGGGK